VTTESRWKAPAEYGADMRYPDKSDMAYWKRRHSDERALADDESVPFRSIHAELADMYAALIAKAAKKTSDTK